MDCMQTVKLPMLIGLQAALKLILPGATVGVEKAKAVGLIDVILEHEDRYKDEYRFLNQVRKFAASCIDQQPFHILRAHVKLPVMDRLLANKIGYRLLANTAKLQLDKRTRGEFLAPYTALDSVMFACSTSDIQRALDYEAHNFGKSCTSAESKHLIFVFLMQQEAKRLQNRFTRAPLPIHNVAILGAGLVGSSIAHWILHKTKAMVLLHDPDENQLRQSQERVAQLLKWQLSKTRPNRLTFATIMGSSTAQVAAIEEPILEEITPIMERIVVSTEYNDIAHVQCVLFSCMHEKLEPAVRVLQASESCVSDETIIAIHSNTFSIDTLARYARRPQRVVGLHFFMPVWRVQLVEIVRGRETSEQTLATAYQFSLSLGKIPIVVNNGPGYVLNRILGVYVLEAARLLVEGATVSIVDAALFNFGMTMGPFRLLDEIGIDIVQQLSIALEPLGKQFSKEGVLHILHNMVEGGYLGRKVNKGFYRYKRGKVMGVEPTLDQVLPGYHLNTNNVVTGQNHAIGNETRRTSILLRNHQDYNTDNHNNWDTQVIVDRCIMLMINEGVRVLEDGVAESPSDIDLAMLFGAGFAPFRGGMLAYADQLGCAAIVKRMQHLQHLCNGAERFKPASLLIRMAQSNKQFFPLRPYPTPLPQSKL